MPDHALRPSSPMDIPEIIYSGRCKEDMLIIGDIVVKKIVVWKKYVRQSGHFSLGACASLSPSTLLH